MRLDRPAPGVVRLRERAPYAVLRSRRPRLGGRASRRRRRAWSHERTRGADRRADQAVRRPARRRLRQHDRATRRGVRLPRPQRGGQDHHAANDARPDPAHGRLGERPGAARGPLRGDRAGRGADRGPGLLSLPLRPRQPAGAGPGPRPVRGRRGRRAGAGRPGRPGRRQVQALLAGHEAAARCRGGVDGRPRADRARRAHQRPRPRRHGRHARAGGLVGSRRPDRAAVQPPAGRGAGDLRPGRRDQRRQAAARVDGRRAARRRAR